MSMRVSLEYHTNIYNGSCTGVLKSISRYRDGVPHGERQDYRYNGTCRTKYESHNGKMHGTLKEYHLCGTISYISTYANGIEHGEYVAYNTAGYVFDHTLYINGEEHIDLFDSAITKEEKFLLSLEHNIEWLDGIVEIYKTYDPDVDEI